MPRNGNLVKDTQQLKSLQRLPQHLNHRTIHSPLGTPMQNSFHRLLLMLLLEHPNLKCGSQMSQRKTTHPQQQHPPPAPPSHPHTPTTSPTPSASPTTLQPDPSPLSVYPPTLSGTPTVTVPRTAPPNSYPMMNGTKPFHHSTPMQTYWMDMCRVLGIPVVECTKSQVEGMESCIVSGGWIMSAVSIRPLPMPSIAYGNGP